MGRKKTPCTGTAPSDTRTGSVSNLWHLFYKLPASTLLPMPFTALWNNLDVSVGWQEVSMRGYSTQEVEAGGSGALQQLGLCI